MKTTHTPPELASLRRKLHHCVNMARIRLTSRLHACIVGLLLLLVLPALSAADVSTLPAAPITGSTTFTGSATFTDTEPGYDADPLDRKSVV